MFSNIQARSLTPTPDTAPKQTPGGAPPCTSCTAALGAGHQQPAMPQAGSPAASGCCRQDQLPEAGPPYVTVIPASSHAEQPSNAVKAGQHPAVSRPEGPPAAAPRDAAASWQPGPQEQRHSAGTTERSAVGLQEAGSAPVKVLSDPGVTADQPAQHMQAVAGKAGCLAGYHWQLPLGLSETDCAWVWVGPDEVAGLAHLQMTLNRQGAACLLPQAEPAYDPAARPLD